MKLEEIRKQVFKYRPVLGEIYQEFGHLTLAEYVKGWEVGTEKIDPVFLNVLKNKAVEIYGQELAEKIIAQLLTKPLVSTVEHQGIWGHPIFVNSALIYSLYFQSQELAIALATESVSLNNITSWSGSVLVHQNSELKRHSFFPDRQKTLPVFSTPMISKEQYQKTSSLIPASFLPETYPVQKSFSEQACVLTKSVWEKVFPKAPQLIYLPLESLVLEYLVQIYGDPSHVITKVIASEEGRKIWQKFFANEHTFLFWGVDETGRRQTLKELPDNDGLLKLMKERKIYPSSPLCFFVLLFVNLTCVGGFTQTTWLTEVKEKLVKLISELEESELAQRLQNIPTKNFGESDLGTKGATALDLFLQGRGYEEFKNHAQQLSLKDSIDLSLPEIYKVVVPKK